LTRKSKQHFVGSSTTLSLIVSVPRCETVLHCLMLVNQQPFRTIWSQHADEGVVRIIDQRRLPWRFEIIELRSVMETAHAISDMAVRGAGCIGVTAAFGIYLAALESGGSIKRLRALSEQLIATRPTAADLAWAVRRVLGSLEKTAPHFWAATAHAIANQIADESVEGCKAIGEHGLRLIQAIAEQKPGQTVNVLTHCNAGWLAFVDHGSATAPIYAAHAAGLPIHVWVDETRPRNQGARLTAWELAQQGVPHTVICDNSGGHLMQRRQVDLVMTGADRVTRQGDAANKIGTYLKALAAMDNHIPFYVALPFSTLDTSLRDGIREIPIEERNSHEITHMDGLDPDGEVREVRVIPEASPTANPAFDVTPARLITGLIFPCGICAASEAGLQSMGLYESE
jgi:methylthioribose-1-phosphate isomerase